MLKNAGELGERCKFPPRGLGRSPSRNRIWCILALRSDICLGTMVPSCLPYNTVQNDTSRKFKPVSTVHQRYRRETELIILP